MEDVPKSPVAQPDPIKVCGVVIERPEKGDRTLLVKDCPEKWLKSKLQRK